MTPAHCGLAGKLPDVSECRGPPRKIVVVVEIVVRHGRVAGHPLGEGVGAMFWFRGRLHGAARGEVPRRHIAHMTDPTARDAASRWQLATHRRARDARAPQILRRWALRPEAGPALLDRRRRASSAAWCGGGRRFPHWLVVVVASDAQRADARKAPPCLVDGSCLGIAAVERRSAPRVRPVQRQLLLPVDGNHFCRFRSSCIENQPGPEHAAARGVLRAPKVGVTVGLP